MYIMLNNIISGDLLRDYNNILFKMRITPKYNNLKVYSRIYNKSKIYIV